MYSIWIILSANVIILVEIFVREKLYYFHFEFPNNNSFDNNSAILFSVIAFSNEFKQNIIRVQNNTNRLLVIKQIRRGKNYKNVEIGP